MEARCRGGRLLFFPRFLFRGREAGVFFPEEGRSFPFASSKGCFEFLFLPSTKGSAHSCVPCGDPTFLCVPRREACVFFSEEGSRFSRVLRRRVSYFFCFVEGNRLVSFLSGGEDFRSRRVAFPRATVLSTFPGRTSEDEGIQLPGSGRDPVDRRLFRKRTDSCFPLFLFSSNRSNLSLFSTKGSNLFLVS